MASKFDTHIDQIIIWRKQNKTWQSMADLLCEKGCNCTRSALFEWFQRRSKRAQKIIDEVSPLEILSESPPVEKSTSSSSQTSPITEPKKNKSEAPKLADLPTMSSAEVAAMSEEKLAEMLTPTEEEKIKTDPFSDSDF